MAGYSADGGLCRALRLLFSSLAALGFLLFVSVANLQAAQSALCEPSPEIRTEIEKAAAVPLTDRTAFDKNVAPFLSLRRSHPEEVFVHERYQDAVQQHGIEGHLRMLTSEYQALAAEHSGDISFSYLAARALIGRSTPSAISSLTDILTEHPDFAPAHRMLAEIYNSEAFHDAQKMEMERAKFQALCPGSALAHLPFPLQEPSSLVAQSEQLLANKGDPNRVAEMALQGIREDEWRLQRIRPFDWYSVDFKRKAQQELQSEYWKLWSIQVRCFRKTEQEEKAKTLLNTMDGRAARLGMHAPDAYWEAEVTLARLYIDAKQMPQAEQKLQSLGQFLSEHPDPGRNAELNELRKLATP